VRLLFLSQRAAAALRRRARVGQGMQGAVD
jgi:hypothetical protein